MSAMNKQIDDAMRMTNVSKIMCKVKEWANAPDNSAKMGCVLLVDKLIDISRTDHGTSMVTRFCTSAN